MRLNEVLQKTIQFFKSKNFPTARLDAELLFAHALKLDRIGLYLKYDQPLSEDELEICRSLVKRRLQGEPIAYICGEKEFFGFPFKVDARVLIPRPETEHLIEGVMEWVQEMGLKNKEINIVDLGTGSGCIGISLARLIENSFVVCVDISEGAVLLASDNAKLNQVSEKMSFINGDCFDTKIFNEVKRIIGQRSGVEATIVVGNPPYIGAGDKRVDEAVLKFEPAGALFSENEGYRHLFEWFNTYVSLLGPIGLIAFEVGSGQSEIIREHFANSNKINQTKIINDLAGIGRVVMGGKNG